MLILLYCIIRLLYESPFYPLKVLKIVNFLYFQVVMDGMNSQPYAIISVGEGTTDPAVARDIAFDSNKHHMYTMTGNRVSLLQTFRGCP